MESRCVARIVNHRTANPPSGVVRAEWDGVVSGDNSRFSPIEIVGAELIAHPIGVWVPEWSGVKRCHFPSRPSQALEQSRPTCAASDDHGIELVLVGIATHVGAELKIGPILA